jgi:hypothetical protein
MPTYLAAAAILAIGVAIGGRRPSSRGLKIVTAFVFVIALFTVALVITYVGVILAGQL